MKIDIPHKIIFKRMTPTVVILCMNPYYFSSSKDHLSRVIEDGKNHYHHCLFGPANETKTDYHVNNIFGINSIYIAENFPNIKMICSNEASWINIIERILNES